MSIVLPQPPTATLSLLARKIELTYRGLDDARVGALDRLILVTQAKKMAMVAQGTDVSELDRALKSLAYERILAGTVLPPRDASATTIHGYVWSEECSNLVAPSTTVVTFHDVTNNTSLTPGWIHPFDFTGYFSASITLTPSQLSNPPMCEVRIDGAGKTSNSSGFKLAANSLYFRELILA